MAKIDGWCPTREYDGKTRILRSVVLKAFKRFHRGRATAIELMKPISEMTDHYKNAENLTFHSGDVERRLEEMAKQGDVVSTHNKDHPYGWGTIYRLA